MRLVWLMDLNIEDQFDILRTMSSFPSHKLYHMKSKEIKLIYNFNKLQ